MIIAEPYADSSRSTGVAISQTGSIGVNFDVTITIHFKIFAVARISFFPYVILFFIPECLDPLGILSTLHLEILLEK